MLLTLRFAREKRFRARERSSSIWAPMAICARQASPSSYSAWVKSKGIICAHQSPPSSRSAWAKSEGTLD